MRKITIAAIIAEKRFKVDNLTKTLLLEVAPEPEYRKLSLHKIKIFRTLESKAQVHPPRHLHRLGGVKDHLPIAGLLCYIEASLGQRLADT